MRENPGGIFMVIDRRAVNKIHNKKNEIMKSRERIITYC